MRGDVCATRAAAAAPLSAAPSILGDTQKSPHPTTLLSASARHPFPDAAAAAAAPSSGNAAPQRCAATCAISIFDASRDSPRRFADFAASFSSASVISSATSFRSAWCGAVPGAVAMALTRRAAYAGVLCTTQHVTSASGAPVRRPGLDESSAI